MSNVAQVHTDKLPTKLYTTNANKPKFLEFKETKKGWS
jgi:hypothetical protein